LGAVPTPNELVEFMVALAAPRKERCRVLEPACGNCPFLTSFAQRYGTHHEFVGIDIDPNALNLAKSAAPFATLLEEDFLLWQPSEPFDLILGNPPYGIIGDASHYPIHLFKERKPLYRARSQTWHGKYNIYGLFIERAVGLLAPEGKLVFVVPASWLVLDDFAKLRLFLAQAGRLSIFYIGKAFPRRNVSCVVMVLERGGNRLRLYDGHCLNSCTLVVDKPDYRGELIRFETPEMLAFERGGIATEQLFEIHFAARSSEIRRHPLISSVPEKRLVPVLTGRNLRAGWIDYERCYSGFWMPLEAAPSLRVFYGFPHLVVGHTKGASVVAAVDERCYPWREEFHLVHKFVEGRRAVPLLHAIAHYLNSNPIRAYVRALYRDFVPHLTATMLRRVPIPRDGLPWCVPIGEEALNKADLVDQGRR
jgi:adenine-specific DNA-methyltransferase